MLKMKEGLLCVVVTFFLVTGISVYAADKTTPQLETENDKISYALGFNLGAKIREDYPVSVEKFIQGFKDSAGEKGLLTEDEINQVLTTFQQQMQQKEMNKVKGEIMENQEKGRAFLEANKAKEGIVTLSSGLQYKILKKGDGAKPKATDRVTCHYRGTTIEGVEFDSSYKRNQPATFPLDGVIKGWTQALQLMPVGSKWMLYIPDSLAYGDRAAGNIIKPGSTLIFEVELLGIAK